MRLGRQYGGVETLEVPDLQDALDARGERNQLARLRRRIRDRLLHQHVRAGFEEVTRDGKVRRGGCGHAHRLDAAQERAVVAHGTCLELGGELLTRLGLRIFGLALLGGLIVMPFLIWFAGSRVLGPYTHGQNAHAGPFALLADFFLGLLHGSAVFWAVALGPAVLLLLIRLFVALVRVLPASGDD